MFVPFESLPSDARIWIFQSNRRFTSDELQLAESHLRDFTEQWVVHGAPLRSSYSIRHDQFVILAADERDQAASGCSIDSSVRAVKELEARLQVSLFDRNLIAFLEGDRVSLYPLKELKEKFATGILNEDTLTFNNLVGTKGEWEKNWLAPAAATWLKRYLPNALAKVK